MKKPIALLIPAALIAQAPGSTSAPVEDDGFLQPTWFNNLPLRKEAMKSVDYAWVKPGFIFSGRSVKLNQWTVEILNNDRSEKDKAKASAWAIDWGIKYLTIDFPGILHVPISDSGGLEIVGRVVDFKAGSKALKIIVGFGAGNEQACWDWVIRDTKSKEILAAFHHRTISGDFSNIEHKTAVVCDAWAQELEKLVVQNEALAKTQSSSDAPQQVPASNTNVQPVQTPVQIKTTSVPASAPVASLPAPAKLTTEELEAKLNRLQDMRKKGLITSEEYEDLRRKAVAEAK